MSDMHDCETSIRINQDLAEKLDAERASHARTALGAAFDRDALDAERAHHTALVEAAQDHADAFWALLNTEHGTRSYDRALASSMRTYDALRAALIEEARTDLMEYDDRCTCGWSGVLRAMAALASKEGERGR